MIWHVRSEEVFTIPAAVSSATSNVATMPHGSYHWDQGAASNHVTTDGILHAFGTQERRAWGMELLLGHVGAADRLLIGSGNV